MVTKERCCSIECVVGIEARGLLVRVPNPANRRSSLLQMTPAGAAVLESASTVFDDELTLIFGEPLSDSGRTHFSKGLATLRAAMVRRRSPGSEIGR